MGQQAPGTHLSVFSQKIKSICRCTQLIYMVPGMELKPSPLHNTLWTKQSPQLLGLTAVLTVAKAGLKTDLSWLASERES